jgi:hypothetical protein
MLWRFTCIDATIDSRSLYTTLLRHSGSKNQNNTTKPKINEKKKNKTKNELNQ